MKAHLIAAVQRVDEILSLTHLRVRGEQGALLIFLFHGLFRSEKELELQVVAPQQRIMVEHFRQFVDHYLTCGYRFVSTSDIIAGLRSPNRYVLITFDDGYFSNHLALPILVEYQVPAVFYISTNHVLENKAFWWDVLHRERTRLGASLTDVLTEGEQLKSRTHVEIDDYLRNQFGKKALHPISDIDRPFTPSELRDFSQSKHVTLGNHTSHHAVLTNYPADEIRSEILGAQQMLRELTGIAPESIAYPNGNYSDQVIRIVMDLGLKLGISCDRRKNRLPIVPQSEAAMRLARFSLMGNDKLARQCRLRRADLHLYQFLKRLLKK